MGRTETFAIVTDRDAFARVATEVVGWSWPWEVIEAELPAPWSVVANPEADPQSQAALAQSLRGRLDGGFMLAAVHFSDGGHVIVGNGDSLEQVWLNVDGMTGVFFPGYSPFDEHGQMLEGEALAELEREIEIETARVREQLLATGAHGPAAAEVLRAWAVGVGLPVADLPTVTHAVETTTVFAENMLAAVLRALGLGDASWAAGLDESDEVD